MDFLNLTLAALADNLALDEALLLEAEAGWGGESLRLWESPVHAVVLGSANVLSAEVHTAACEADAVPVLRRASGGGAVVVGPGCLCFTLVLSMQRRELWDVGESYRFIMSKVSDALQPLVPELELAGSSDLAIVGRKVSGNSQRRKRDFLLHHGTLLHQFDLSAIDRYLQLPARQPAYRSNRAHAEFLTNLPLDVAWMKLSLQEAWHAATPRLHWPADLVRQLVAEKYANPEWTHRR